MKEVLSAERSDKAFTFLETVMVVFLISLFVAVAIPSFGRFSFGGLDPDSKVTASVLRFVDDTSRITLQEGSIAVDLDNKTIEYERDGNIEKKSIDTLYSVKQMSSEEVRRGRVLINIAPGGITRSLTVGLRSGADGREVQFNPYSGRVTIDEVSIKGPER
ncbi:MAG: hypothetical protein JSV21_05020 [Nitrospirota bacterium]|nr:MAG: hypothetical protein JSV21_05020 [Nitrospirota bacterium]